MSHSSSENKVAMVGNGDAQVKELLREWCESLLALQISDDAPEGLRGGILCPACARVHGRSLDALYPFLYMADSTGEQKWLDAAKRLFSWAEVSVSRPDGSYVCDTNNAWYGITVFSVIQMCEAILHHGRVLDAQTRRTWEERIGKAANFLMTFQPVYHHNVNYRFSNALAMQLAGELLGEEKYLKKGKECAAQFENYLTDNGLLFGEGVPPEGTTPRGCRAVDIGYNVEESLPSLAMYAELVHDKALARRVAECFEKHIAFMLPDGAWDNSFGTRNFKWTYWGSRTSDGCLAGCLLAARYRPVCNIAAWKNFRLLKRCTHNGLLYGGVKYQSIGERPCVHHTFTHAKVLASLLDWNLAMEEETGALPRTLQQERCYYPEVDTFLLRKETVLGTLTGYDWEYVKGGHASGGNLTMLWHPASGPVLCGTMNEYTMHEPNNQQLPRFQNHQCLSPRLEVWEDGSWYTTLYDLDAKIREEGETIVAAGQLRNKAGECPSIPLCHETRYSLTANGMDIQVELSDAAGCFVVPILSDQSEPVSEGENFLEIEKASCTVKLCVEKGKLSLPEGRKRCYNLIAGFEALKINIEPEEKRIHFHLEVKGKS